MHYTQRLKGLREDKDQKQEAIAIMLDITRQQYQLYESGKRKLPIDHLITLCKYYQVSSDYILGFTNDPAPHWNNSSINKNIIVTGSKNNIKNINIK
ncbi:MAG: helix-turn-helix transcriptional regulator [Acutalibacteraceae bacterium]|nr:helix-turn-helix transcriptional regulator [Acutalibacteraceae bacterium]